MAVPMKSHRPQVQQPNIQGIPQPLRDKPQWVCWQHKLVDGDWKKVPINARTGKADDSTNPNVWVTFEKAVAYYKKARLDGVGYVFDRDYIGTDLDKCRDPETGKIQPWAMKFVKLLATYVEISPSGTGLRLITLGKLPDDVQGCRKPYETGKVEIYDHARYFTFTGRRLKGYPDPQPSIEPVVELHRLVIGSNGANHKGNGAVYTGPFGNDLTDEELLELARNSQKFCDLFDDGDTTDYDDDDSRADEALCCELAFWTNYDAARIDALFRQSALMREKWERQDYRERTIQFALDHTDKGFERGPQIDEPAPETEQQEPPPKQKPAKEPPPPYSLVTPPHSFVSQFVEYGMMRTDAPPEAHELMALCALSALAGPKPRLPLATRWDGEPLVLWGMYIVDSTVGRKSTVIDGAIEIIHAVLGDKAVLAWEGSPQGIIQRLQQRDGEATVFWRDEYSGLLRQMNQGGHMAGLSQTFIRCFDGRPIENIRTKKRHKGSDTYEDDTDSVRQPYLAKLCASTFDSFVTVASPENVIDGFLARFIFLTGKATPRRMQQTSQALKDKHEKLVGLAWDFFNKAKATDIGIDDAVLDRHWELEQKWTKLAQTASKRDAMGPALKRLSEAVLKVAGLLAIDESNEDNPAYITVEHFEQALAMGQRWLNSTWRVVEALGRSDHKKKLDTVWKIIQHYPNGMKMSHLYRKQQNLKTRELEEVLRSLQEQARIRIEQEPGTGKRGRSPRIVFPVKGKI